MKKNPVLLQITCSVIAWTATCLATLTASSLGQQNDQEQSASDIEARLLGPIVQLTFEGRRGGEGYFNADGTEMVFQSERRAENPFYQIYTLNFETGETALVSPGHGKTTCAWLHPDGNRVLFASTQNDPQARQKQLDEIAFRESGQTRRYSWDYDENYELIALDRATGEYTQLTDVKGYDAEASYSPDGQWIAFASNRTGYSDTLSEEDRKKFDNDLAWAMDIYIMKSDGSEVKRLTDTPGYDGGPFFSPDGKRICWRRFSENGLTAEIYTMNVDGSDQKQLTKMNVMSWAPFYHPSGRYIIFTTNKHGFGNFELYLVDAAGQSTPTRVTGTEGFDGLASFTPDGKSMTWTSNRNSKKQSQIYMADWNHEAALKALGITDQQQETDAVAPQTRPVPAQQLSPEEASAARKGAEAAEAASASFEDIDIIRHVDYLCRKELGGRMTGSIGEKKATAYVAAYLNHLGVEPAGEDGTYFQKFTFPNGAELGEDNRLTWQVSDDVQSVDQGDFRPLTFSGSTSVEAKGVVFAGYGIVAPKTDDFDEYDSYVHLDVKDKWVMVFRFVPEDLSPKQRQHFKFYSGLRKKAFHARKNGAIGLIVVSGPTSQVREQLVPLRNDFAPSGSSIAAISITDDLAQKWLSQNQKDLAELQKKFDSGEPQMGFEIKDLKVSATTSVKKITSTGRNVIGRLQMGDTPSEQVIVVGAHVDHLGAGKNATSLAKEDEQNQIHVGADDNASGVAAMLEIAEFMASIKEKSKPTTGQSADPKSQPRDFIFAAWSGEELGLHGSRHFAQTRLKKNSSSKQGNDDETKPAQNTEASSPHDFVISVAADGSLSLNGQPTTLKEIEENVAFIGKSSPDFPVKLVADLDTRYAKVVRVIELLSKHELKTIKFASSEPNDSDRLNVIAALNMDMVGRLEDKLVLQGLGSSSDWTGIIESKNVVVRLPLTLSDDTDLPTDATSFYQAGVPILSAFTGSHTDYHTPRDTPEKLNYPAAAKISKLMGLIALQLSNQPQPPKYVKQSAKPKQESRGGVRAYLGTVPSYGDDVVGVKLSDVTKGAPAEVAGVQGGDIIVELSGQKIENIYDYTAAIDGLKINQETIIAVQRGDKRLELKITPKSRQ